MATHKKRVFARRLLRGRYKRAANLLLDLKATQLATVEESMTQEHGLVKVELDSSQYERDLLGGFRSDVSCGSRCPDNAVTVPGTATPLATRVQPGTAAQA